MAADMAAVAVGVQVEVRMVSALASGCKTLATSNTLSRSRMRQRKHKSHILTTRNTRKAMFFFLGGGVGYSSPKFDCHFQGIPSFHKLKPQQKWACCDPLARLSGTPQKLPGRKSPLVASSAPAMSTLDESTQKGCLNSLIEGVPIKYHHVLYYHILIYIIICYHILSLSYKPWFQTIDKPSETMIFGG